MSSFKNFGLDSWLLDTLDTLKIHTPTEVQVACIPPILQGKNVIGTAKTGSGKTAAFALPILQLLSKDPYGPFALILTPTRELALQIGDQFKAFGVGIGAREAVIVGGMDFIAQSVALSKRPHIIVATPGRLADLLESSSTKFFLKLIRFLVLDEVDRLLHASFSKDLDTIFQYLPEERQTLIYSATTNAQVNALIHTSANEAKMFIYQGECEVRTPDQLRQQYMLVPSPVKEAYLLHLLQTQFKDASMIIFTNRCRYVFLFLSINTFFF
ncbi:putative ATP-dependent RNA helicase ddx49 [Coelomomyces lativittatus]|nr:putative ATP-dependent RNA helicase ddx49 [Coelomomyces lativittatus]